MGYWWPQLHCRGFTHTKSVIVCWICWVSFGCFSHVFFNIQYDFQRVPHVVELTMMFTLHSGWRWLSSHSLNMMFLTFWQIWRPIQATGMLKHWLNQFGTPGNSDCLLITRGSQPHESTSASPSVTNVWLKLICLAFSLSHIWEGILQLAPKNMKLHVAMHSAIIPINIAVGISVSPHHCLKQTSTFWMIWPYLT